MMHSVDRDAINTGLFEQHCATAARDDGPGCVADAIIVLADDVAIKNGKGKYMHFGGSLTFWQSCGEADCHLGKGHGRMDPALKLYRGCPVMLTQNHDVPRGKANGTRAVVKQVVLKRKESPTVVTLSPGVKVWAARAGQVDKIILHHLNDRVQPATFEMQPKQFSFHASLPTPAALSTSEYDRDIVRMTATQLPFVSNSATTGHKLQGCSVDKLFVHNWRYVTNWPYVVVSRIRTRKGLFFRVPLDTDIRSYAVPPQLTRLLQVFQRTKAPPLYTDAEYLQLFGIVITANP